MTALALKSGSSPPIWQGRCFGSKTWMRRTPLTPARRFSQNAAGVDPIGVRTPSPVITARRRELVFMSATRYRSVDRPTGVRGSYPRDQGDQEHHFSAPGSDPLAYRP